MPDATLMNKILTNVKCGEIVAAFNLLKESMSVSEDVAVWLKLGNMSDSSGMKAGAIKCYQQAIALKPNLAHAYAYMGKAYIESDDVEKALGATDKAVQLQKNDALCQFYRGYVLHAVDKFELALQHFKTCLKLSPGNAMVHALSGSCCQSLGRSEELVYHYETSLNIDPRLVDSMIRLGGYYQSIADYDRAEQYFDEALAIKPTEPAVLSMKANLLVRTSRQDEAYTIVKDLISNNRATPYTLNVYAELCEKFDEVDEFIKLSKQCLANAGSNNTIKRDLGFALGKIYDNAEDYDQAFDYFSKANQLFYKNFNLQGLIDHSSRVIGLYNKEFFIKAPKNTSGVDKPIFIIGMPRSGTSLTEQILSRHSKVYGGGELPYIRDIVKEACIDKKNNVAELQVIGDFDMTQIEKGAEQYIDKINKLSDGAERVTDKMPSNFLYVGLIAQLFPEARIIHCRRDPRDTCLSIFFQNFGIMQPFSSDLTNIAKVYMDYERLMKHWVETLNIQMYELHYENIVDNFESQVREILEYCDLEWEDECLDFYKSKRNVATASFAQVDRPIYTKSKARWENYKEHINEIEEILAPVL